MESNFSIKQIKKELGITDKDIARFFGYKNAASYYHADRRKYIEQGIVNIYRLVQTTDANLRLKSQLQGQFIPRIAI